MQSVMTRVGWLLFLVGSIVFLADGIRLSDVVTAVGSGLFVAGVIAFLVAERETSGCPLCGSARQDEDDELKSPRIELKAGSGIEFGEM